MSAWRRRPRGERRRGAPHYRRGEAAGGAGPAGAGGGEALRVVSILGLLRWLVVEGGFLLCATVATGAR